MANAKPSPADYQHAYTIGDVEYKEVEDHVTGEKSKLLFGLSAWPEPSLKVSTAKEDEKKETTEETKEEKKKKEPPPRRKIFIASKIKRVWDIEDDQFSVNFHIYFSWLPTYKEYMSYCQMPSEEKHKWQPDWYPNIQLMNKIKDIESYPYWEEHDDGKFRMMKLKGFFTTLCDDLNIYHPDDRKVPLGDKDPIGEFDANDCYFIRAKYEIGVVLSEEFELESYPFDAQNLAIIMRETTRGVNVFFLPEMRKGNFASFDPRTSRMNEWDVETFRMELGSSNAGSSRSATTYPMIMINLKCLRRYEHILISTLMVIFLVLLLSFTVFSIDFDDTGTRLGFSLTLMLTAVLFDTQSNSIPYVTFMDRYILSSYAYLSILMVENSLGSVFDSDFDDVMFYVLIGIFILQHVVFIIYAIRVRKYEKCKMYMDSDNLEEELALSKPTMAANYTRRVRCGVGGRLLSFIAYTKLLRKTETE
eukprot:215016_1